ncbi:thiamine phosphate synthase [Brevundimonas viscosa]|uniref:Thiamine-phosphate pyrophosphorylase n=1 Tax=Brevundimonas viscosa TaxID=871741 RepID=A0A1I6P109_9CAUL|nr:thiamine phosphate synthase [Brevundimonas viscosa]SFS33835.1 thiamine-phosphate pyrophosphorylase [Brevundimonas viscosa]
MSRTDAEILWEVACGLARTAAEVSRAPAPRRGLPPLLFFTDPARTPRPWETAARLPAGAGLVFRHFGAPDASATARRLRDATAAAGVRLLIGLDAGLAAEVGADGVHLPERALGQAQGLAAAHPGWLVTGAVHGADGIARGGNLHAMVLSPVFVAGGASAARPALRPAGFRALAVSAARPVYALGGITARNAPALIGCGACGLAGVEAIQAAFGPS